MGMLIPFRHLWTGLSVLYYDLMPLTYRTHLPWLICMLPWLILMTTSVVLAIGSEQFATAVRTTSFHPYELIGLPALTVLAMAAAGPATAALYDATWRFHDRHQDPSWSGFFSSMRHFYWRAWIVAVLDLIAFYALVLAFFFYWNQGELFLRVIAVLVTYPLVFWFMMQPFLMPALTQLDASVTGTFRYAAALTFSSFSCALAMLVVTAFTIVASVFLNLLVLLACPTALALGGQLVARDLLDRLQLQKSP